MKKNNFQDKNFDLEDVKTFSDLENPIIIKDRYRVIKKIAEGGTSNIYKALDLENNNIVALKSIKKNSRVKSAKQRFDLEAENLLKFSGNPNVLKIYEYFKCGNNSIIVMEFLKGSTLKQIIRENKILSIDETLNYLFQVINALKDLHNENIMHRDLKPQNIIVNFDDTLKLMDFGIVQASEDQSITQTNYVVGSVEYMAPEVLKGNKATPRSEIYSLGIMAYSMLTGVTPLKGMDFKDTAKKHLSESPESLLTLNPSLDKQINAIVLKMLRKNDFERYQTVSQLEEALNEYIEWRRNELEKDSRKKYSEKENWNLSNFRQTSIFSYQILSYLFGVGVLLVLVMVLLLLV